MKEEWKGEKRMLRVPVRVNDHLIHNLEIVNQGVDRSYARGCVGTERIYKYSVLSENMKVRSGEIKHDRKFGALALIKLVIEDLED